MKTSEILPAGLLVIGLATGTGVVRADSTDATCEVRKDGEKQKGKSGPCSFSQRQGHIEIDLKNGDSINLSPAGGANHYRDQHGNKVTRASAGTTGMSLKWDNGKHVNVTWRGGSYGGPSYNSPGNNHSYGSGSNRGSEYQRGYYDGQRGDWDRDKHNQDYKDGYAAGEAARGNSGGLRGGNQSGHSGSRNYGVNPLDNGHFEIVFSQPFCTVEFKADGRLDRTSQDCTDGQIEHARDAARRER